MFTAYVVVTVTATIANGYAAANDFIRPKWLLANMTKIGRARIMVEQTRPPQGSRSTWCARRGPCATDWGRRSCGAYTVLRGCYHYSPALARLLLSRYASRIPSAGHRRTNTGTICAGAGRVCARGEVAEIMSAFDPNENFHNHERRAMSSRVTDTDVLIVGTGLLHIPDEVG